MIIRTPKNRDNPYAIINNYGLRDPNLSWQAKGLLAYLLSLPNNWHIRPRELSTHASNGVKIVYSIIKELAKHGYLQGKRVKQTDSNLWGGYEYIVHEYPSLVKSVFSSVPIPGMPKKGTPKQMYKEQAFRRGEVGNYNDPDAIDK